MTSRRARSSAAASSAPRSTEPSSTSQKRGAGMPRNETGAGTIVRTRRSAATPSAGRIEAPSSASKAGQSSSPPRCARARVHLPWLSPPRSRTPCARHSSRTARLRRCGPPTSLGTKWRPAARPDRSAGRTAAHPFRPRGGSCSARRRAARHRACGRSGRRSVARSERRRWGASPRAGAVQMTEGGRCAWRLCRRWCAGRRESAGPPRLSGAGRRRAQSLARPSPRVARWRDRTRPRLRRRRAGLSGTSRARANRAARGPAPVIPRRRP